MCGTFSLVNNKQFFFQKVSKETLWSGQQLGYDWYTIFSIERIIAVGMFCVFRHPKKSFLSIYFHYTNQGWKKSFGQEKKDAESKFRIFW